MNSEATTFPGGKSPRSREQIAQAETLVPVQQAPAGGLERIHIEGFKILELLGRGGMAIVYKARQISLQREVALKVMLGGASASRDEIYRFRIETESIAQLRHPNIVQIHEVSLNDGSPFCSLEFVEGGTLSQRHRRDPLDPHHSAELVEKIARAIEAAHQLGIIHRDLKPSNVLLTADGEPKVSDFGIAKRLDTDLAETKTGAVVGTPGYMAPEQAAGAKNIGRHTDIYGLGAILYELLTGRPPFHSESSLDTVLLVISEEPQLPSKLKQNVPHDLETICMKCLEKDPRRRYATAEDLADDLQRFLSGEPIHAKPPGFFGKIDRWARLRPALALQLTALTFFYILHLIMLFVGVDGLAGQFHIFATALAICWGAGACGFQWLATRTMQSLAVIIGWSTFDITIFTIFLLRADGPQSPILPGYFLMIAASALRLRKGLIWAVTVVSIVSYLAIVLEAAWHRPQYSVAPVQVLFTSIAMLMLALIQHFSIRKIRATLRSERTTRHV